MSSLRKQESILLYLYKILDSRFRGSDKLSDILFGNYNERHNFTPFL